VVSLKLNVLILSESKPSLSTENGHNLFLQQEAGVENAKF